MNARYLVVAGLISLAFTAGCRRDVRSQTYLDAAGAEMLELEDRLYELQFDYEDVVAELEACQKELESLRRDVELDPGGLPRVDDPVGPPMIDPGVPIPGGETLPQGSQSDGNAELLPVPADPLRSLDRVTHIHVNPLYTGGVNFDEQSGDDGISLAIEPRNDRHQLITAAGDLSVELRNPGGEGEAARFASWEIDAAEVALALHKAAPGRGIRLELPWPDQAPRDSRLRLVVRYTTSDGRQLEAQRDINVRLAGQRSASWTPRIRK